MSQIKTKFIENGAVTGAKIASNAVDENKIATSVAGAGLTGGGGAALAVGAGSGISVAADSVAVDSTVVRTNGANAFTADQSMGGFKLTNLASPSAGTDAANKSYVDSAINGLDWKQSVRAATTAAGTLATDFENADVIDGVTLATGDRILIKNQASGSENGIYTVNASGAPTRATDADVSAEVTAGMAVFVEEGTSNADSGWVLTTDNPITLGTTALVFAQFTGAGSITAGAGLTKTGNTLDVGAGDGISVAADSVAVSVAALVGSGIEDDGANNFRIASSAAGAGLTGGSGSALAVGAGDGITVNADDVAVNVTAIAGAALENDGSNNLRVRVDASTVKINGSNNLESLKQNEQRITLNGTDITNQYVDLSFAVYGTSASVNSVQLSVVGGLIQQKTVDYTVSLTGGAGGVTRITFAGDLATGGAAELVATDILVVSYSYLT